VALSHQHCGQPLTALTDGRLKLWDSSVQRREPQRDLMNWADDNKVIDVLLHKSQQTSNNSDRTDHKQRFELLDTI